MKLHAKREQQMLDPEELKYYWDARRNDPDLDARLYAQEKAEALEFVSKVQNILLKALTGEDLTPEEQEMVDNDQALQLEIDKRKSEMSLFQ